MPDITGAFTPLKTLTVRNDASVASLSLIRQQDGGLKFTDAEGNTQYLRDPVATLLFEAIDALV